MRGASWTEVGWQNILPVRLDGQKDPSTHLVLAEVVRGGDEDSTDLRFSMKAQGAALVGARTARACRRLPPQNPKNRWQPVKPSRCRQALCRRQRWQEEGVHKSCLPSSAACLTCGRVRGERWHPVKPSRCRQAPSAALPAAEVEGRGGS